MLAMPGKVLTIIGKTLDMLVKARAAQGKVPGNARQIDREPGPIVFCAW